MPHKHKYRCRCAGSRQTASISSLPATYFGRNYADFDPTALKGAYADKDSWRVPDYVLFNVHAGYSWKVGKVDLSIYGSILNLFNTTYVSDAQHRVTDSSNPAPAFDPKNVEVFFGPEQNLERWTGVLLFNVLPKLIV